MGLKGTLNTIPILNLLRLLAATSATGRLEMVHDNVHRTLYFNGGRFVSADSTDPKDFMGHFLVSQGKITEDQLSQAMVIQQRTRKQLTSVLMTMGIFTEAQLAQLMVIRCMEILFAAFLWEDADFEFFDNTPPSTTAMSKALEVEPIAQEAIRRAKEYKELRRIYPTRGVCFAKTSSAAKDSMLHDPVYRMVYGFVDGKRTVREIVLQTHANEYAIFKCLHALKLAGLVSVVHPNKEPTATELFRLKPEEMLRTGKAKLAQGSLDEAMNLFRYILKMDPENKEAKDLLARAEATFIRKIYDEAFSPEAVPVLARRLTEIVSGEKLNSEESFMLSRVNGQWDVKSILAITPLSEVEGLRLIKRLLDRNIIRFRQ